MSKKIRYHVEQIISLQKASELVSWNMETGAPEKSLDNWGETLGMLAGQSHRLTVDPNFGKLLKRARPKNSLERKIVAHWLELHLETKKVPVKLAEQLEEASANSTSAWKDSTTFEEMLPHLEKVVSLTKDWAACYDEKHYDSLIECYEPGADQEYVSSVFDSLKPRLIELRNSALDKSWPVSKLSIAAEKSPELWTLAAEKLGFDLTRGMIGTTMHPFMMVFDKNDVRIAVNKSQDALDSFYGAVHEIGHALYEQNTADELINTGLGCPFSCGLHESQSLFCEQFLGKSDMFWRTAYDDFAKIVGVDWQRDKFLSSLRAFDPNNVIRLRATELDYGLHIMLRFEVEKALFSGQIETKHMRDMFNELTMQYFGRYPKDDRKEGVLQDTHWPSGLFGYFPSYLLGAMFACQLWSQLSACPDVPSVMLWLNANIHQFGATRDYRETLTLVTGDERPSADAYLAWLKQEFFK